MTFVTCREDLFERRYEAHSARVSSEFHSGMYDLQKLLRISKLVSVFSGTLSSVAADLNRNDFLEKHL